MDLPFEEWTRAEKDEYARKKMAEMKLRNEKLKERHAEVERDRKKAEAKHSSVTSVKVFSKEKPVLASEDEAEYDYVPKPKVKEREWDRGKSSMDSEDWNPHKFNRHHAHWKNYSDKKSYKKEENWRDRSANASKDLQGSTSRLRATGRPWGNRNFPDTSNPRASNQNDNVYSYAKQRGFSKGKGNLTTYKQFSKFGESRKKPFLDVDGSASQSPDDSKMDPMKQPAKIENDKVWRSEGVNEVRHRRIRVEKWVKSVNSTDPEEEGDTLIDINQQLEYRNKNWSNYDLGFKNSDIPAKEYSIPAFTSNSQKGDAGNYFYSKHNLEGRTNKSRGMDKKYLDSKCQKEVKKVCSDKNKHNRESDASDYVSSAKESDYHGGYRKAKRGKVYDYISSDNSEIWEDDVEKVDRFKKSIDKSAVQKPNKQWKNKSFSRNLSSSDYSETYESHGVRKQSDRKQSDLKRSETNPLRKSKLKTAKHSGPSTFENQVPLVENQEISSPEYDSSILVKIERHTVKRTFFNNNYVFSKNESDNVSEDVPCGDCVPDKVSSILLELNKCREKLNCDYDNIENTNISENVPWCDYVQDELPGAQLEDKENEDTVSEDIQWGNIAQDKIPDVQVECDNQRDTLVSKNVPWSDYVEDETPGPQLEDEKNEKLNSDYNYIGENNTSENVPWSDNVQDELPGAQLEPKENEDTVSEDIPWGDIVQDKIPDVQVECDNQRDTHVSKNVPWSDYVQDETPGPQLEDEKNEKLNSDYNYIGDTNISENVQWSDNVQDELPGAQLEPKENEDTVSEDIPWGDIVQDKIPDVQVECDNQRDTHVSKNVPWSDYVQDETPGPQLEDEKNEKLNSDYNYIGDTNISENVQWSDNVQDELPGAQLEGKENEDTVLEDIPWGDIVQDKIPDVQVECDNRRDTHVSKNVQWSDYVQDETPGPQLEDEKNEKLNSDYNYIGDTNISENVPQCDYVQESSCDDPNAKDSLESKILSEYSCTETSLMQVIETSPTQGVERSTTQDIKTSVEDVESSATIVGILLRNTVETQSAQDVDTPSGDIETSSSLRVGISPRNNAETSAKDVEISTGSTAEPAEESPAPIEMSPALAVEVSSEHDHQKSSTQDIVISPGDHAEASHECNIETSLQLSVEDLEVINSDLENISRSPTSTAALHLNDQTDAKISIENKKDPNNSLLSVSKETAL